MDKNISDIKFNITHKMALIFMDFWILKSELLETKKLYDLNGDKMILSKIKFLEQKLENDRNLFIKEFQKNNENEINEYLKINNQIE